MAQTPTGNSEQDQGGWLKSIGDWFISPGRAEIDGTIIAVANRGARGFIRSGVRKIGLLGAVVAAGWDIEQGYSVGGVPGAVSAAKTASKTLAGATTGALIGSMALGPVGAIIGGIIGGYFGEDAINLAIRHSPDSVQNILNEASDYVDKAVNFFTPSTPAAKPAADSPTAPVTPKAPPIESRPDPAAPSATAPTPAAPAANAPATVSAPSASSTPTTKPTDTPPAQATPHHEGSDWIMKPEWLPQTPIIPSPEQLRKASERLSERNANYQPASYAWNGIGFGTPVYGYGRRSMQPYVPNGNGSANNTGQTYVINPNSTLPVTGQQPSTAPQTLPPTGAPTQLAPPPPPRPIPAPHTASSLQGNGDVGGADRLNGYVMERIQLASQETPEWRRGTLRGSELSVTARLGDVDWGKEAAVRIDSAMGWTEDHNLNARPAHEEPIAAAKEPRVNLNPTQKPKPTAAKTAGAQPAKTAPITRQ